VWSTYCVLNMRRSRAIFFDLPRSVAVGLLFLANSLALTAQRATNEGSLQHVAGLVAISTDTARPEYNAVWLLREEYGWLIDYEDPEYSEAQNTDVAIPRWHLDHPNEAGVFVPKHRNFSFTFTEGHPLIEAKDKLSIVTALTDQANASDNMKFKVVSGIEGRVALVGITPGRKALGDTMIILPPGSWDGAAAFAKVLSLCEQSAQVKVYPGITPFTPNRQIVVKLSEQTISCRDAVSLVVGGEQNQYVSALFYDLTDSAYYWSVLPALHATNTQSGGRQYEFVKKPAR
jgi:hypothetical protein